MTLQEIQIANPSLWLLFHFLSLKSGHSYLKNFYTAVLYDCDLRKHVRYVSRLKDLGVLGSWELSLVSVVVGLSLFWSRLVPPCSSDFPGCLAEGSRPDMNSMLCFRLSSLSYWKDKWNYPFLSLKMRTEKKICLINLLVVLMMQCVINLRAF